MSFEHKYLKYKQKYLELKEEVALLKSKIAVQTGGNVNDLWKYDRKVASPAWVELVPKGVIPASRTNYLMAYVEGGDIYIYGGNKDGVDLHKDMYKYSELKQNDKSIYDKIIESKAKDTYHASLLLYSMLNGYGTNEEITIVCTEKKHSFGSLVFK